MAKEKLPKGFERLPSGSIRVRIRVRGHTPAVQVFPLIAATPAERTRQRLAAEAWATETRARLLAGAHVSTRDAENMTLRKALELYADQGLRGSDSNARKDKNRIRQILSDPIADRSVASLRSKDLASYRDYLQSQGEERRGQHPKRTTITNKIQQITRALTFLSERIDGVPQIAGVAMPKASPGRERRLSPDEEGRLLEAAERINPLLPSMIRFALLTALRRERILTVRLSNIVAIGNGHSVIKFPSSGARNKRTGIIPITAQLQEVINTAISFQAPMEDDDAMIFGMNGNTFDHRWRTAVKTAGLDNLHFHDLRHEATSRLFEGGLTTAEVMSITGHSTNDMVDRYSHYSSTLVLDKLESKNSVNVIATQIKRLVADYVRVGGKPEMLHRIVDQGLYPPKTE